MILHTAFDDIKDWKNSITQERAMPKLKQEEKSIRYGMMQMLKKT